MRKAGELLPRVGSARGEVLLLSDGIADPAGSLDAVHRLRSQGVQTSVLGVGRADGAPVDVEAGGFEDGPQGGVRLAGLDQAGLSALASAGGGRYLRLAAALALGQRCSGRRLGVHAGSLVVAFSS